jgi:hypothetical protein
VTFTATEIETGRELTEALNNKISATITSMSDPRLKFVDATTQGSPFTGKQLCTSDSHFNGVDLANTEFSFHPNLKGQEAYNRLFLSQY